jgi:hypothetical protein
MHLVLTGATGLVGASVLHSMLAQESISRISILSRRPVAMAEGHDKAKVIIHNDYNTYEKALLEELKDAQGCVWAQGVSQNDVTKECAHCAIHIIHTSKLTLHRQYVEITHDYPLAAARAFATLHPDSPFTFVYVSGEGATQTPGIFTPIYGRVKGQTETALFDFAKQNPMFKVYNVRPGVVDWTNHAEIHPFIPQQATYKKVLIAPMNLVYKSMMTPTQPMGKVMMELAMSQGEPLRGSGIGMEGTLISNVALRRMSGL